MTGKDQKLFYNFIIVTTCSKHISWIFSFKTMFRWRVNHDLDLLREVVAGRPKNHTDWALIADKLNGAWGNEENPVRGRS